MEKFFVFNITTEFWGAILCIAGLFCIRLLDITDYGIRKFFPRLFVCDFAMLVADAFSCYFDGKEGIYVHAILYVVNILVYICSFTILSLFTDFLCSILHYRSKKQFPIRVVIHGVCMILNVVSLLNFFYPIFFTIGPDNVYRRTSIFWMTQSWGIVVTVTLLILTLMYRNLLARREFAVLLSYVVLPSFAMMFQIGFYGLSILNISTTFLLMVCFIVMMMEANNVIYSQKLEIVEHEAQLADSKAAIMLSQIQPHFLYNTLNSIYYLCGKDPAKARVALEEFSDYLRVNLESLKVKELVPFERELQHIEKYLWLEQLRFDDRLEVEYDIEVQDFKLPSLTIQPLVENAVKHGICKRIEGGTVIIHSHEAEKYWVIEIRDDGVGFSPGHLDENGHEHVGVDNVRRRLEIECNGFLEILSTPGEGTVSIVRIPKEV